MDHRKVVKRKVDGTLEETDPLAKDSDVDGINDGPEVTGFWCYAGQSAPCPFNGALNPKNADFDSDGLRDGQEIAGWMVGIWYERTMEKKLNYSVTSKPMTADTDGDTMTDFDEFMNGSDPWKLDTDGDTITDPQEVARGSNITGIEGTPPEITNVKLRVAIHGHEEQLCTKLGCLPPFWVPDGWINVSTTPGAANWTGEDKNLNGIRDQDAEGNWTETDFQANDSDFDGVVDGADLRGTEEARGLAILF